MEVAMAALCTATTWVLVVSATAEDSDVQALAEEADTLAFPVAVRASNIPRHMPKRKGCRKPSRQPAPPSICHWVKCSPRAVISVTQSMGFPVMLGAVDLQRVWPQRGARAVGVSVLNECVPRASCTCHERTG